MSDEPNPTVRCHFQVRARAGDGQFHYEAISLYNPRGDGYLHTPHPPAVGDHIHLWDVATKRGGNHRVIARAWLHSSYGSTNWPHGRDAPIVGPILDLIVEAADGPLSSESPTGEDADYA